jgi:hypothetical protein
MQPITVLPSSTVIGKNEWTTAERVCGFAGLTLSDLRKSLLEGTLEEIMWVLWGTPSIPLGRGDLHISRPELCD